MENLMYLVEEGEEGEGEEGEKEEGEEEEEGPDVVGLHEEQVALPQADVLRVDEDELLPLQVQGLRVEQVPGQLQALHRQLNAPRVPLDRGLADRQLPLRERLRPQDLPSRCLGLLRGLVVVLQAEDGLLQRLVLEVDELDPELDVRGRVAQPPVVVQPPHLHLVVLEDLLLLALQPAHALHPVLRVLVVDAEGVGGAVVLQLHLDEGEVAGEVQVGLHQVGPHLLRAPGRPVPRQPLHLLGLQQPPHVGLGVEPWVGECGLPPRPPHLLGERREERRERRRGGGGEGEVPVRAAA